MQKTMLLGLFVMLGLHANSQVRLGFNGGVVLAKTNEDAKSSHRTGLFLAMVMDLSVAKSASLRPQLKYIMKGQLTDPGQKGTYNYLELPVNYVCNIPVKAGRFSVGGGPVVAYMISGSWVSQDGSKEEIYFKYDKVNRLDLGLNAYAGFEVKGGVFFNINYTLGLRDVWIAEHIGKNKNRALSLGVGIMF
jgi:Outer membrane protein beta-barrel domain